MSQLLIAISLVAIFTIICSNGQDVPGILEITPANYNQRRNHGSVNITCQSNNTIVGEKAMNIQLQIQKDGKPLALAQTCWPVVFVSGENVYAHGHVDQDDDEDNHSFLTLTLENPTMEDAGEYTCIVHFRDDWKFVKMLSTTKNLTMNSDVQESLSYLMNEVTDLKTQLQNMKDSRDLDRGETSVHFTAGFTDSSDQVKRGQTVRFRDVIKEEGGGYDSSTGVFTAPVKGVYEFHLTIMTGSPDNWMNIDLKVNSVIQARLRGGDDTHYDQSTVSALVNLEEGDEVYAHVSSMHPEMNIFRYPWSLFSGFLLKAL